MTILYCISDHGYGHAARSGAVIRLLRERVIVRNLETRSFLSRDLPGVEIIPERNDIGLIQKEGSLRVDVPETKRRVRRWLGGFEDDVERLRRHIRRRKVTLVVSDSSPQPLLAASLEGIPGIFLGSFTWVDVYDYIGILAEGERERLMRAYATATTGIILPLSAPCAGIVKRKEVGLIARRTQPLPRIPRSVLFAIGGSLRGTKPWRAGSFTGTVVVPPEVPYAPASRTVRLSRKTPLSSALPAVDVLVAKSGYSLVAEAMRAKLPMFLLRRPEFIDDEIVIGEVERLGIGREVEERSLSSLVADGIFKKADALRHSYARLPVRYRRDGAKEAARIIRGYA